MMLCYINDELICAVQQGNLDKLRELIGASNLRTPSEAERGYVLLCAAIDCGHKEIIEFLLQRGALVNPPGDTRCVELQSPLFKAIHKEDVSLVQTLLDLGAFVDKIVHAYHPPLSIAIAIGNVEIVKLLVKNNADVKFKFEGDRTTTTILDLVSRSEKLCLGTDIIELLIDKGATLVPNSKIFYGLDQIRCEQDTDLQLHLAVNRGYLSVVEHLLKRGASANSTCTFNGREGYTPLHIACKKKDTRTAECLLRYGADVNAYAEGDLTPLHVAVGEECTDLVELLLTRGANVDASDRDGKTALFLAVKTLHLPTVNCILKSLPNVENQGNRKSLNAAVLTYDCKYDMITTREEMRRDRRGAKIIASLVKYGFTVRSPGLADCHMLHIAIEMGLLVVIDDFLKHCVDINAEFFRDTSKGREGFTLLHAACKDCNIKVVRRFLDKGAEIDARAKNGNTPLHETVLRGSKNIVKLLLDAGANINHQNEYGYSVLSLAVEKENADMVELILKHGPDIDNKAIKKSIRNTLVRNNNTIRSVLVHRKVVESLYRYGFSIDSDILYDSELLKVAIKGGFLEIIEDFLKHSTKDELLSCNYEKPIRFVLDPNNSRLLITYEFDMNINIDNPGQTPILYAMMDEEDGIEEYLGARYIVSQKCKRYSEVVDIFLQYSAVAKIIDGEGQTTLNFVSNNKIKEAKLLVWRGSNVTGCYSRSMTPFYIAIERSHFRFEILFLERIVPDFKNKKYRKLLTSKYYVANSILFKIPLKSGADINSVDEEGKTCLDFAFNENDKDLVLHLLDYGCDVNEIMVTIKESEDPKLFEVGIRYILKRHIIKLIVAGLERSDVALYRFKDDTDFISQCLMELETVEKENVPATSVSFRDILTEDVNRLATYAKNETLVTFLTSEKCRTKFPLYSSVMKGLIWRGIVRKCLLERSIILFRSYGGFFCELPDVCVEHILSHLNDEDLRIFTRCNSGIETKVGRGFPPELSFKKKSIKLL